MSKKIFALGALAAVVVLAGCGGSDSSTLSKDELTKQATAICKDVAASTKAAAASGDFDKSVTLSQEAMTKLKALDPPSDLKDSYTAYLDKQQAVVDIGAKLAPAIKAGDKATAQALIAQGDAANAATDAAAAKAGLPACGAG